MKKNYAWCNFVAMYHFTILFSSTSTENKHAISYSMDCRNMYKIFQNSFLYHDWYMLCEIFVIIHKILHVTFLNNRFKTPFTKYAKKSFIYADNGNLLKHIQLLWVWKIYLLKVPILNSTISFMSKLWHKIDNIPTGKPSALW